MASKYLTKLKFPFRFGLHKEYFRFKAVQKRIKRNKEKNSLERKIQEFEFCTPWCPNAAFPEETELCKYSGMLKCRKYNELVGKYAVCLDKRNK